MPFGENDFHHSVLEDTNKDTKLNVKDSGTNQSKVDAIKDIIHEEKAEVKTNYAEVLSSLENKDIANLIDKQYKNPDGTYKSYKEIDKGFGYAAIVQIAMKLLGNDPGKIDGVYGVTTKAAVIKFQTDFDCGFAEGKSPDGLCGPLTFACIVEELNKGTETQPAVESKTQGATQTVVDIPVKVVNPNAKPEVKNNEVVTKNNTQPQSKESPTFVVKYPEAENTKKYILDQMGFPQIGNVGAIYNNHEFAGSTINAMRDLQKQGREFTGEPNSGRDRFGIKKDGISVAIILEYDALLNKSEKNNGIPTPQELENNINELCKKIGTNPAKVDAPTTGDAPVKVDNAKTIDAPVKGVDPTRKQDEFDDEFDTDDGGVDAPITLTNPEQITLPEAVAVADKKRIDYVKNNMMTLIDQTLTQKIDKNFKKVLVNVRQSLVENKIDAKGIATVAKQGIEGQLTKETKEKLQNKKNKPIFESFSAKMKQIANEGLNKPVYTFEMQEAERFTALDKKLEAHGKITESIEKNNALLMQKIEKEQQNYVTSVKNYNEQFAIKEKNILVEKSLNKNDPAYTQKRQESYNAIFNAIATMAVEAKKMQTSMIHLALYEGTQNWTDIEKNTDTIVQELTNTNTLLTSLNLGKTITPQINELNTLKTVGIPAAKSMSEQLQTRADVKMTDIMEEVTGTTRTQTKTLNELNKTLSGNQWAAEMKQGKDGYITPLTKTESLGKVNFDEWTKTVEAKKQGQEKNNAQTDADNKKVIEKKQGVLKQSTEQDTKLFAEADKKMSEAWGKIAEAIKKNPIDNATVTENMAIIKEQDVLRKGAKERISTHYYENQLLVQQTNHGEFLHMDDAVKATQALLDVKEKQQSSLVKKSDALKKQYAFLAEQSLVINDQDANSKATQESQKTLDAKMGKLEEEFGVLDGQIGVLNKEIATLKTTVTELSLVRDTHQTDSDYLGYNAQHEITKERIATLNSSEQEFVASKGLLDEQSKVLVNDIATIQTQQNTLRTLPKDANDPKAKDENYEFKQITGKYALSAKGISADRDLSTKIATKKTEDAAIQEQIKFIDEQILAIKEQRKPYEQRLDADKNAMETAKKKLEEQDAKAYKNVDNCYTPVYTPEQITYPVEKPILEEEKK